MKNKKLVILISSLVQRGAERRASDLANQLSQKGYNVDLIALEKGLDFNISKKVSYFKVSSLKARANKLVKLIYSLYQLLKLSKIEKTLRKLSPDIVLSFMGSLTLT